MRQQRQHARFGQGTTLLLAEPDKRETDWETEDCQDIATYLESGQIYGLLADVTGVEGGYEVVDGEAHGGGGMGRGGARYLHLFIQVRDIPGPIKD